MRWDVLLPNLQASTVLSQRTGGGIFCNMRWGVDHSSASCTLSLIQQPLALPLACSTTLIPAPPSQVVGRFSSPITRLGPLAREHLFASRGTWVHVFTQGPTCTTIFVPLANYVTRPGTAPRPQESLSISVDAGLGLHPLPRHQRGAKRTF